MSARDEGHPNDPRCESLEAAWCPVHGDCICPRPRHLNSRNCPLHGHPLGSRDRSCERCQSTGRVFSRSIAEGAMRGGIVIDCPACEGKGVEPDPSKWPFTFQVTHAGLQGSVQRCECGKVCARCMFALRAPSMPWAFTHHTPRYGAGHRCNDCTLEDSRKRIAAGDMRGIHRCNPPRYR